MLRNFFVMEEKATMAAAPPIAAFAEVP